MAAPEDTVVKPVRVCASVSIEIEELQAIRHSLLMGLACYGELERIENEVRLAKLCSAAFPDGLKPIGQSGDACEVSRFADALLLLNTLEDQLTRACHE